MRSELWQSISGEGARAARLCPRPQHRIPGVAERHLDRLPRLVEDWSPAAHRLPAIYEFDALARDDENQYFATTAAGAMLNR
jgi:hypothetical protein